MASGALQDVIADRLDPAHLVRRVDDWEKRVRSLLSEVRRWLPPGWKAQEHDDSRMDEELMVAHGIPARQLPILVMWNETDEARIEPKGLWVIGTNGRIDLTTRKGRFIIVDVAEQLAPARWQVASAQRRSQFAPFDEAYFRSVL